MERVLSWVVAGGVAATAVADDCVGPHTDSDGDHDGPSHPHSACHCGGPLGLAKAERPTQPMPSFQVAIFCPVIGLWPTVKLSVAGHFAQAHPAEKPPDVGDRLPLLA